MPERRAMLKRPPHILVTTPESLYILLTAERSRAILRDVETVIVDEIHAVADDKRGAHLALSLERLAILSERPPVRIGLSATQKPIEEVAHFLTGTGRPDPVIVNIGHKRTLDLGVEVPASALGPVASNEMWGEMYDRLVELVTEHRSTLVFVNTRRMAERVAHQLGERLGEENVAAHHGSLSRKLRLAAEKKLKEGQVKVLVATASLELGIDVGTVDLVVQINSPRSIAVALQRVGRSGHWRGAVPKGRFFVTTRDDLIETAALVRAIKHGDLDRLIIPECPLDILAQQIVACCAAGTAGHVWAGRSQGSPHDSRRVAGATDDGATDGDGWNEDELFELVRKAYPYRGLTRELYEEILEMLSEGIASRRGRYGAYLHRDRVNRMLRPRRGARLAAITSGGAIPETALFNVVLEPEGINVGTLDEDFAVESSAGDIMLLGNTSWRIRRVEGKSGRVLVEDAHGAAPTVPFWRGEAPARTNELSDYVGGLRQAISDLLANTSPVGVSQNNPDVAAAVGWLKDECGLDDAGAEQAIEYVLEGRAVLGAVPTQTTIIAERFFDEAGGMQLIIHAPFGGRINKAWGLALRKRFCRGFNFELQAAATDNGLNIALAEQHSFPLADVFQFLSEQTVPELLEQASLASPIFGTRWRWDANRALALLRFQGGKKVPPQIQRMRSDDLLASVFPDVAACQENIEGDIKIPDHPLIREVMKDVLQEAMDLEGLKDVLRGMESGKIRCIAVDTPVPSQFSHEILNANPYAYLDDAPLEERRARAVEMRRMLPESVLEEVGKLDPAAIGQVQDEAWPDVRDADELQDVLHTLVWMPEIGLSALGSGLSGEPGSAGEKLLPQSSLGERRGRAENLDVPIESARFEFREALTTEGTEAHGVEKQGFHGEGHEGAQRKTPGQRLLATEETAGHGGSLSANLRVGRAISEWQRFFDRLVEQGRAVVATVGEVESPSGQPASRQRYWVAAERVEMFSVVFPEASFEPAVAAGPGTVARDEVVLKAVTGWMSHLGPTTASELSELLGIAASEVEQALLRIEMSGAILRGKFVGEVGRSGDKGGDARIYAGTEWCERRLLARIHRLTVATLRKQIEPVTAAQFMRWLLRWQHVIPGTQVAGDRGTLEILAQLQGFEIPANAWERQVLARRVANYDPKILDQLCLMGNVGWGRLSPHPATLEDTAAGKRRVIPTSVAPITFFVREQAEWMLPHDSMSENGTSRNLSESALGVLKFLKERGASFFADIVRETGKLKAEIETGLWELVAAGIVTADGFDNLRALIDPKRRAGQGSGKMSRPRHSAGRWALLHTSQLTDRTRAVEATCWMLLRRYGVVFRDLMARETNLPKWRELQIAFRRLEDRGEIRGGRFVSGFLGEQFALPVAVESLRASRRMPPTGETVVLSAADPLNLVGILVPGDRVPAISGRTVAFRDGVAEVAAVEAAG